MDSFDGLDANPVHGSGNTHRMSNIEVFNLWELQLNQSVESQPQTNQMPQVVALTATANTLSDPDLEGSSQDNHDTTREIYVNLADLVKLIEGRNDFLIESPLEPEAALAAPDDLQVGPAEDFGVLPEISAADPTSSDDVDDRTFGEFLSALSNGTAPPQDNSRLEEELLSLLTEHNEDLAHPNGGQGATSQQTPLNHPGNSLQPSIVPVTCYESDYFPRSDDFGDEVESVYDVPSGTLASQVEGPVSYPAYSNGSDGTTPQQPFGYQTGDPAQFFAPPVEPIQGGVQTMRQPGMPPMGYTPSRMSRSSTLPATGANQLAPTPALAMVPFDPRHAPIAQGMPYYNPSMNTEPFADATNTQAAADWHNLEQLPHPSTVIPSAQPSYSPISAQHSTVARESSDQPGGASSDGHHHGLGTGPSDEPQPKSFSNLGWVRNDVDAPKFLARMRQLRPYVPEGCYYTWTEQVGAPTCPIETKDEDGKRVKCTVPFTKATIDDHIRFTHFAGNKQYKKIETKVLVAGNADKGINPDALPRKLRDRCEREHCPWCDHSFQGRGTTTTRHFEKCHGLKDLNDIRAHKSLHYQNTNAQPHPPVASSSKRKEMDSTADPSAKRMRRD